MGHSVNLGPRSQETRRLSTILSHTVPRFMLSGSVDRRVGN